MKPFRVTAASQLANASPSITLERGAYRMRAPLNRSSLKASATQTQLTKVRRDRRQETTSRDAVTLLFILIFACIACFGTAYYLFTTRWEHHAVRKTLQKFTDNISLQVPENTELADKKYLAYFPHSGFHNQRIALENALVLSTLLNRTLLLPPIRLGKPISYVNFYGLERLLSLSSKDGLLHCAEVPAYISLPPECTGYFEYTHIPWSWLINMTNIERYHKVLHRPDMSKKWIFDHLLLSPEDIRDFPDESLYHYRFFDNLSAVPSSGSKYLTRINISDLVKSQSHLIQFGTIFGSSRLRLQTARSISIRSSVRQSMSYTNPDLVHVANAIELRINSSYIGVHIRASDGEFKSNAKSNLRRIWWIIVHEILRFSAEDTLHIERRFGKLAQDDETLQALQLVQDHRHKKIPPRSPDLESSNSGCRRIRHDNPRYSMLNAPIFIATDLRQPEHHHMLSTFRSTFPCSFFLSDFPEELAYLDALRNELDGIMLKPFLFQFVDAMVAARGWTVVGTERSTYSAFVEDVLWTTYHDLPIVQWG